MSSGVRTIYLFRHGEVEPKYQKRFRGVIDCDLSAEGKRMSEKNAEFLRAEKIDKIITTGLKRADYVGKLLQSDNIPHEIHPGFREANFGKWEGKSWDEVLVAHPVEVKQYQEDFDDLQFPGGESIQAIRKRILSAWQDVMKMTETKIAIVGHSTCNTTLVANLKGKKFREVTFQVIGSFHEIAIENNVARLVRENVILY